MRKSTLLLLTLLLGFLPALAQQVVTGTVVTAPDNEAAIGASIIVKERGAGWQLQDHGTRRL